MDLTAICFAAAIIVGLISGVVQMIKVSFGIPSKLVPLLSCVVGVVVGLALQPFAVYSFYTMAVAGFVAGLASCGFFDLTKIAKKKD